MNITNHYWYFKSAIPGRICDDIIKFGLSKSEVLARTAGYDNGPLTQEEIKDLKKKRNSDIVWLNDSWLYKELHPYIQTANRMAGWNYEWDRSESIQFTKYKLNHIMIGIVIVGINLMIDPYPEHGKFENYL